MLTVSQTEAVLKTMLEQAGVNFASPDVRTVWEVFKRFADFNRDLDAFFAHVESVPEFLIPITHYVPVGEMACGQWDV
jgi:hypothetical protein